MFSNRIISIVIGIVLVIGVGTIVYVNKPSHQPTDSIQVDQSPNTNAISEEEDDDDDEDKTPVSTTPTTIPKPPTTTPTPTPAPAPTTSGGITLNQVVEHSSRSSCWSAINGNVDDLTSWIPNHPGGEQKILSLCGIDGSSGYNAKHGGSSKPARILGGFKIGVLAN